MWPFSKAISSAVYNGIWQLITDSQTWAQYLNLIGSDFFTFVLVFVSLDFELGKVRPSVLVYVHPSTKRFL